MGEAIKKFYIINGNVELSETWEKDKEGKVIYEVLKVIKGKPLFYKEHYIRMKNSFTLNSSEIPFEEEELEENINRLIKVNEGTIGNIKITYNLLSKKLKVFFIKHSYPTADMYKNGVKTIFYFGERENPNAKVVHSEFRNKVTLEINENNAFEAILVNRNGYITEGSKSNIFMIKGDTLYTSEVKDVLPGVTRSEIIKVAKENNIEVKEKNIHYTDISNFEALFISGTSPDILPINSVDKLVFDTEQNLLLTLMDLFKNRIIEDVK